MTATDDDGRGRAGGDRRASCLSGAAKVAGVIGWPVAHSLSPCLHGYWLARHGIDGAYVPLPVRPEHLADALRALPKLGIAGVNVTVPHKEAAAGLVDVCAPDARRIGAVNTISVQADGRLYGFSTDGFGFVTNVRATVPDWQAPAGAAVVIGSGGSARAIVAALIDAGVPEIRLVNRTPARAEALARDLGAGAVVVVPWPSRHRALAGAALVVNATTLGMQGQPPLDLDLALLPETAIVADIVYVPLLTPLLLAAGKRRNPVVDGLGMLLHQARPGFARWFGVEPQVTEDLRRFVLEGLAPQ
jgi:shikimate dehydrogenase